MTIICREATVLVESGNQMRLVNVENTAAIMVEPCGERGGGPMVTLRLYAQDATRDNRSARANLEVDRQNTKELVRKLILHFGFTPEELQP